MACSRLWDTLVSNPRASEVIEMINSILSRRKRRERIESAQRRRTVAIMDDWAHSREDEADLETLRIAMSYDDGTRYSSADVRRELGL